MKKLLYVLAIALLVVGCKTKTTAIKSSANQTVVETKELDYGSPKVKQVLVNDQMFLIEKYAADTSYGYTESNPIMVGKQGGGPLDERRFLNALTGPNGEQISYFRLGSCCYFKTKNGLYGNSGLLDKYQLNYKGLKTPIILYINMYDSDTLQVPVGLKLK